MYLSWGRNFHFKQQAVSLFSRHEIADVLASHASEDLLPHGLGRSYGDSCLNENGTLLLTKNLDNFISFDLEKGVLRCEAGVSLDDVMNVAIPHGWFIPVSPGTRYVTVGGAVANDVHGKNHHRAGTFGRHVRALELVRSDGQKLLCSPTENVEMFCATIGGLGLTGLITWVEFQLLPIQSSLMKTEHKPFHNLGEFFTLCDSSDANYDYTVAWLDSSASGKHLGRGIFMRANHELANPNSLKTFAQEKLNLSVPVTFPNFVLNQMSIRLFNKLYYLKQASRQQTFSSSIHSFFYPLDSVHHWNRVYGKRGFFQFQCAVPFENSSAIQDLLRCIVKSGCGSFLTVLKKFGDLKSPGLLSFPIPGYTLALDFANEGSKTKRLFDELTHIVRNASGRLYPAKDSLMTAADFDLFYPYWKKFTQFKDPKFSSSFWRRVTRS